MISNLNLSQLSSVSTMTTYHSTRRFIYNVLVRSSVLQEIPLSHDDQGLHTRSLVEKHFVMKVQSKVYTDDISTAIFKSNAGRNRRTQEEEEEEEKEELHEGPP